MTGQETDMPTFHRRGLLAIGPAALATPALAHDYTHGDLRIAIHGAARPAPTRTAPAS